MPHPLITQDHIDAYQRDGAVLIKGLFRDFVDRIAAGIEKNLAAPGPFAGDNLKPGESGRFFEDYCNWERIPDFADVVRHSPAAEVATDLMQSSTTQMFHEHVLVKEPGTAKPTPWHQDSPYYFVEGMQNVSFWAPVEPVTEATLRCVAGSHRWEKEVLPTRWLSDTSFYPDDEDYMPTPDPEAEGMEILEWPLEPGDAVAFHFRNLHGARGNETPRRRRAFSLRLVGDDARYVERPGPTSPPYPGHDMKPGQKLREDWFPILYTS